MNVIETSGLGKRYGSTWALHECTLAIPAGHVAALVGPNGAGKTTLLAARAVGAAHRRDRLAGPPPGDLNRLATTAPDDRNPGDPGEDGRASRGGNPPRTRCLSCRLAVLSDAPQCLGG
jgi:energy-coupling factor transporter ATP-binding protein EcfA2